MEGYTYTTDKLWENGLDEAAKSHTGKTLLIRADLSTGNEYELGRFTI